MAATHRPDQEPDRPTPYGLVFADTPIEADRFPEVREQADAADPPVTGPEDFLRLPAVTGLLRELVPSDAPGHAMDEYGRLLYHAFEHWRHGQRVFDLETALVRHLAEGSPRVGEWELVPPQPAGYMRLPPNLVWSRAQESRPPEPVDGLFWAAMGEADPAEPPLRRLDLLLVLGVRRRRPGYSVIAVGAELGDLPTGHWADADARPDDADFANILPGGEIEQLYALMTEVEALKLASRVFWYLAMHPEAVGASEATTTEADTAAANRSEAAAAPETMGTGAAAGGDVESGQDVRSEPAPGAGDKSDAGAMAGAAPGGGETVHSVRLVAG